MAMNRQSYIEMVVAFLSRLKNETGFNMETPLDHSSRISLAAVANSADNMGEAQIGRLIKKALESNDPKTQEILLYSGLSQGPISDKDVKSVFQLASEKLQGMGGDPEGVASRAVAPEEGEETSVAPFSDLLGDTGEPEPEDAEGGAEAGDALSSLLDDEGDAEEAPAEPMGDEPEEDADPDVDDGRIAKESDEEELAVEPEPELVPMNDWYNRFNLAF